MHDARAPLMAAVSQLWASASQFAQAIVRDVEVPAPRRQLNTSSKPSIDPSPGSLEESLTTKWGATLDLYSPLKITGTLPVGASIDRDDMTMLLNLPGNSGWLSNYTIDAFFTTFMPQFSKALQPGLLRIFLLAFISKHGRGHLHAPCPSGISQVGVWASWGSSPPTHTKACVMACDWMWRTRTPLRLVQSETA